jgi:hypothetical protein
VALGAAFAETLAAFTAWKKKNVSMGGGGGL